MRVSNTPSRRTNTRPAPQRERVVTLLFEYLERLRIHFFTAAERHELTAVQAKAIMSLEVPTPMRGMAQCLSCDPSNITGVVNRLEERGLVARVEGTTDRRVKHLTLTHEGARIRRSLLKSLRVHVPGINELNAEELSCLERALAALCKAQESRSGHE
ncbi:MAG: MarR family transcriptional regulator [Phycisphaerales bacterium]|nr:MAG: MarR family transcriptional regulator [Phycisphaerales bacterium]